MLKWAIFCSGTLAERKSLLSGFILLACFSCELVTAYQTRRCCQFVSVSFTNTATLFIRLKGVASLSLVSFTNAATLFIRLGGVASLFLWVSKTPQHCLWDSEVLPVCLCEFHKHSNTVYETRSCCQFVSMSLKNTATLLIRLGVVVSLFLWVSQTQ